MGINCSSLSVGDWFQARMVKWDYEDLDITPPMRVAEISSDEVMLQLGSVKHYAFVEDLQPIPITPEILEKNGVALAEDYDEDSALYACPQFSVIKYGDSYTFEVPQARIHVEYAHELQHAIRLAGIEKEIEV